MQYNDVMSNLNDDFTCSKREYPDKNRFLNNSLFVRTRINGEVQSRPWLVFSKSTGTMFCAPCRLFGSTHLSTLVTIGFNDWKNAVRKLNEHENFVSTLESDRLNATSILRIESEMIRSINYNDIIDDSASKKVRRKML